MSGFVFYECISLLQPTGRKAGDIEALLLMIREADPGVIYHHTHQYYLKASIQPPEYPNDFAVWVAESLEDRALAEKLASLDLYGLNDLSKIQEALTRTIEEYLEVFPRPRAAYPGQEFFFNDTVTLVIPSGYVATDLKGFREALRDLDTSSIYFHFFESRLRLGNSTVDFCRWLDEGLNRPDLSRRIGELDPYFFSLEGLRSRLLDILEDRA